jgi:hypothetical protein
LSNTSDSVRQPLSKVGSEDSQRVIIILLQILVGGLVTGGGLAFSYLAVNTFGTILGVIHFSIGVASLALGAVIFRKSRISKGLLISLNALVIIYSLVSEALIQIQSLLPPSAAQDSLIGSVIAIIMSAIIIVSLLVVGSFQYLSLKA